LCSGIHHKNTYRWLNHYLMCWKKQMKNTAINIAFFRNLLSFFLLDQEERNKELSEAISSAKG
jgi:hypothetical protein